MSVIILSLIKVLNITHPLQVGASLMFVFYAMFFYTFPPIFSFLYILFFIFLHMRRFISKRAKIIFYKSDDDTNNKIIIDFIKNGFDRIERRQFVFLMTKRSLYRYHYYNLF